MDLHRLPCVEEHLNADCADLSAQEKDTLNDWVAKFEEKYLYVGKLTDGGYNGNF